ncbi:MAG TPA: hypothetical protein VGG95_04425 [Edaphobacter sp.]
MVTIKYGSAIFLATVLLTNQVGVSQVSSDPTLPQACAKEVTPATGKPYMFPPKASLQFGLSSRPGPLSEKAPLAIWVSNPTAEESSVMTCEDLGFFFVEGFDVFDHEGVRMLSNMELQDQAHQKLTGRVAPHIKGCLRNFAIPIPPHSCVHGDFEKPNHDFVKYLGDIYPLRIGSYEIRPKLPKQGETSSPHGLTVEITP